MSAQTAEEFIRLVVDDSAEWPDAVIGLERRDAAIRAQARADLLEEIAAVLDTQAAIAGEQTDEGGTCIILAHSYRRRAAAERSRG